MRTLTDWRTILIALASSAAVFVLKKLKGAFIVIAGLSVGFGVSPSLKKQVRE